MASPPQISKLALLPLAETREACAALLASSVLSLQEVPKSSSAADRNPQRTFFLYHLDLSRALAWLEDNLLRTQARLAQRRARERARQAALLAKVERTDVVKEGVEKVLSRVEKERLADCRKRLEVLTVQEGRVARQAWVLARMRG